MRGKFITFEGFEGSGKSTQIALLSGFLKKNGYRILILREPGSTKLSENIRRILLDKKNSLICEKAELFLYLAARSQIVKEKILPALEDGILVFCDRFQDATAAYQGYGLGLDKKLIASFGEFSTGGLKPDLTILLDIDCQEGLRRAGKNKDRIESRPLVYHKRVRQGYLDIARREPARVKVIRVGNDIKATQEEIKDLVERFLSQGKHLSILPKDK